MTKIKRGDVVLVEVVFSSGFGIKLRPALVLSDNEYNKFRNEVIVSGITSNIKLIHKGDTEIIRWEKAGLKVPSMATAVLQTVKKDRIQKSLGQIEKDDFERIEENISKVLGFSVL
ncbi:MAG: type II toxin-antitoxin system PemK/MazF family toxin [Candidatus Riflebacteria bacterium]|nr:type II toxin-antitoxin system PemK/MazF family toxin [Candidatus Riflebacteria bacterium]